MSLTVDIEKRLGAFHLKSDVTAETGITGLLGASGSGKSLTLKCIAGIETPDRGRIVLDGVTLFDSEARVNLPPQQRRVGYLFQNYALFPNMTVRQNILCGLHGVKDRKQRGILAAEALRQYRLEELAEQKPATLSGGQAQRAALARILVSAPKLLLLDEPFSALDAHLRLQLQLELKEWLSAYGGSVLLVTHSRDEAYHMCGRIAVADAGTLCPARETGALFADPATVPAARITGCKNIAPAVRTGEYEVEVPDWNVRFRTDRPVGENLAAVGVRAHRFDPETPVNRFPVRPAGEMEEPFAWIFLFRYPGQSPDTPPLWYRVPKAGGAKSHPHSLGVAPENVLLLY